jgi:hypothetical protein
MIYYLHEDVGECARMLDDRSLDKQIKMIAQTLKIVYYRHSKHYTHLDKKNKYADWASECVANYLKLVEMGLACIQECYYRWNEPIPENTPYKYSEAIEFARDNVPDLPIYYGSTGEALANPKQMLEYYLDDSHDGKITPFPLLMPEKYLDPLIYPSHHPYRFNQDIIVKAYRNYYCIKIKPDAKWTRREKSKELGFNWHNNTP